MKKSVNYDRKNAFTLAEVLITLTVLGVIAAITIPSIHRNYQERVQLTQFKQTVAIVENVLQLAMVENGSPDTWDGVLSDSGAVLGYASGDKVGEVISKYLQINKFCKRSGAPGNDKCLPSVLKYPNDVYGFNSLEIKCLNGGNCNTTPNSVGGFMSLKNGATIGFSYLCPPNNSCNRAGKENRYYMGQVFIDTNGKKGPNRFGYDMFYIPWGKIGLWPDNNGNGGSGNPSKDTCLSPQGSGQSCGRYVMKYQNMDYKRKNISDIWK